MTSRIRSINFVGFVHEMQGERLRRAEPLRGPSGEFLKAAILRLAHRHAQAMKTAAPYSVRLAICLKAAWLKARQAGAAHSAQQADRRWPLARLVANAQTGARA